MTSIVTLETRRTGYSVNQVVNRTMTVGDLISLLENFDEDSPIVFSNDNGYTYGEVVDDCFDEVEPKED